MRCSIVPLAAGMRAAAPCVRCAALRPCRLAARKRLRRPAPRRSSSRTSHHALVLASRAPCPQVGLRVAPRKTTKAMSEKKKEKRMRCTPFVKRLNYNHVMCVAVAGLSPRNWPARACHHPTPSLTLLSLSLSLAPHSSQAHALLA